MKINHNTGLLKNHPFQPSPNVNERPEGTDIDMLVIHGISLPEGEYSGKYVDQLFTNQLNPDEHPDFEVCRDLQVSAHVVIWRDGTVTQYVPFHKRAWHAGVSVYDGRENCGDFSIGIEMEGCDHMPYEPQQYETLARLSQELLKTYPKMNLDRIVGHSDIAPDRKTDPGPHFDWEHFRKLLSK